jgi:uncharacterized membrane protein
VVNWKTALSAIFHPTPSASQADTSLRYTDILFGFVIRELFLRLQHWSEVPNVVRAHLIVGTILVLGSWIGFRRSLKRSSYDVKFFNLPFFQFLADQGMLILYFRVATLTPAEPEKLDVQNMLPKDLTAETLLALLSVFVLYLLWDILGLRALYSFNEGKLRYQVDGELAARRKQAWQGLVITFVFFAFIFVEWFVSACFEPIAVLNMLAVLLLLYRWIKEIRTTWQSLPKPVAAE